MNASDLLKVQRTRSESRYTGPLNRWLYRPYKTKLSATERSIIYGSLLGDGHLEISSKNALNYRYTEDHAITQRGYLNWKKRMTGKLFRVKNRTIPKRRCSECNRMVNRERICPRCDSLNFKVVRHPICEMRSGASPLFTILHNKFYSGAISTFNAIINNLGPLGLAVLYMDDGNLWIKNGSYWIEIYLMDMPKKASEIFVRWLWLKFHIKAQVHTHGRPHVMISSRDEVIKFINVVEPYVRQVRCMSYKINP